MVHPVLIDILKCKKFGDEQSSNVGFKQRRGIVQRPPTALYMQLSSRLFISEMKHFSGVNVRMWLSRSEDHVHVELT